MILTCPDCATRYVAPDGAIGPNGRTVRCASCHATWFVSADPDALALKDNQVETLSPNQGSDPDLSAVDKPQNTSEATPPSSSHTSPPVIPPAQKGAHVEFRDKKDRKERQTRRFGIIAIWAVALILILIAAALAYIYRQDIVNRDPRFATLYQSVGIEVNAVGLTISPPITRSFLVDGAPVLTVSGTVKNISGRDQALPFLKLSLHDGGGEELVRWAVTLKASTLKPGQSERFETQYANPPLDSKTLRYAFSDTLIPDSLSSDQIIVAEPLDETQLTQIEPETQLGSTPLAEDPGQN